MPNPLSQITVSNQNSRSHTSGTPSPTIEDKTKGAMAADDSQDSSLHSNLSKHAVRSTYQNDQSDSRYFSYSTAQESLRITDGDEPVSLINLSSSPFQAEAEDDTVDSRKLRKMLKLSANQRSTTPRKRSYEDDHTSSRSDLNHTPGSRPKGSPRVADVHDINIYEDEDSEIIHQPCTTSDGSEVGNGVVRNRDGKGVNNILHDCDMTDDKENMGANGNNENGDMTGDFNDTVDDTCLSTFSAIPDMTTFAKLRSGSPAKVVRQPSSPAHVDNPRLRRSEQATVTNIRQSPRKSALIGMSSPVRTPQVSKDKSYRCDRALGETASLLDLVDTPVNFSQEYSSTRRGLYSPSRKPLRTLHEFVKSPIKGSLLDFDMSPAPTPRSVPTITPRELESLKSEFMSEISSLKATLSGREAEVASLKAAVTDAERRVGEALEEVRNEVARKEALEMEQVEWIRRGQEMEKVLQDIKEEIVEGEQEKEALAKRVEELERDKESLERQAVKLESHSSTTRKTTEDQNDACNESSSIRAEETAAEIQNAVEKVARELHTLYKRKHETKVAALKKSYEARWEKRVREAEDMLKAANGENRQLKAEREAATARSLYPDENAAFSGRDKSEAERQVLEAQIQGLRQEMITMEEDNKRLHAALKLERAEKGELVAVVDEWLQMQQSPLQAQQSQISSSEPGALGEVSRTPAPKEAETPVRISKQGPERSGIRQSNTGSKNRERKIPKAGIPQGRHARGTSGSQTGTVLHTPSRGGIMSSIERMGRGGI